MALNNATPVSSSGCFTTKTRISSGDKLLDVDFESNQYIISSTYSP